MRLSSLFVTLLGALAARAAQNQLQQITANIGPNPNNVGMFVYKPSKLASPLPLIVAIHQCTGSATEYFESTQYATLADEYGFIVVFPNSPRSGSCFDVNTPQTLSHNGGGDSQGIASMVTYSISTFGVDPSLVFVTGTSSGAMMTNVMAGSYPELFQAASVYSGVAFGCFAGSNSWNSECADGDLIQTPQQWGAEVQAAYPGYTGSRPRMMLWHGTADTTLYYPNYGEEIKEWTDVFGVSQTPVTTVQNDPQTGYTLTTYGTNVVGFSAAGVGHTVPVHETIDLAWFGIIGPVAGSPPMGGGSAPPVTSPVGTPTTTQSFAPVQSSPAAGTVAEYGQCGGIGWSGGTVCASPFTCKAANSYYSQCL